MRNKTGHPKAATKKKGSMRKGDIIRVAKNKGHNQAGLVHYTR